MINILYLVSTLRRTGPTNQLLNIVSNLDKTKFNPVIVTLSPEPEDTLYSLFLEQGLKIESLNLSRKKFLTHSYPSFKKILNKFNPHIIHSSGERADLLGYICALKNKNLFHITTLRNYPYEDFVGNYGIKGWVIAKIYLNLINRIEHRITCSNSLKEIYLERENIITTSIQNSVSTKRYYLINDEDKKNLRTKLGFNNQDFIFINTGGLLLRKDPKTTIEAFLKKFSNNNNYKLLLLGEGQLINLKDEYKEKNNVLFLGKKSNIHEYLQISDVFVSSSSSEGLPNAVLEAMSTGLPCILSDIPQHRETFGEGKFGKFHKLYDTDDLSEKLSSISLEIIEKENIREYIIKNFSSESMSEKYQNFYMKVMLKNEKIRCFNN
ncbi:glycosyltransferase [Bacillus sp. AFS041924]|uniref:glycosyltransferase n=1 Tax=Bacillus sp. AFS041924 TaxID=2033503 RepID=UPI000BFCFBCF|nr:glycosyltransferase [Bacillus sp. AFS041924]PGS56022.1 hypothetical protein COC46_01955 [Bacillus sp. AFS041924]